jgi:hypothetical protein
MTASFTDQEFAHYVHNLELPDIDGIVGFIRPYVDDLSNKLKGDNEDQKKNAYFKYSVIMAEFGVVLLKFAEETLEFKNQLLKFKKQLEIAKEAN